MKTLYSLFIVLIALTISSCSNLVYQKPVPQHNQVLTTFPKNLQGTYVDSNQDTLFIYPRSYQYGKVGRMGSFSGELNKELILKNQGSYYFLNFQDNDGFWELIGAKLDSDQLILYFVDIKTKEDVDIINSVIKKGKVKSTRHEGKYVANPSGEEMIELFNHDFISEKSFLTKIR
jgi:hypothetical protein